MVSGEAYDKLVCRGVGGGPERGEGGLGEVGGGGDNQYKAVMTRLPRASSVVTKVN